MSETPRTHAAKFCPVDLPEAFNINQYFVKADEMEKLERNLARVTAELKDANETLADHEKIDDTEWRRKYADACILISDYSDENERMAKRVREEVSFSTDLIAERDALRTTLDAVTRERDELKGWKKSALTVESWWKEIDTFIRAHPDAPLGRNVSDIALAWLKERDAARKDSERIEWLEKQPTGEWVFHRRQKTSLGVWNGKQFRAAIDAAITAARAQSDGGVS